MSRQRYSHLVVQFLLVGAGAACWPQRTVGACTCVSGSGTDQIVAFTPSGSRNRNDMSLKSLSLPFTASHLPEATWAWATASPCFSVGAWGLLAACSLSVLCPALCRGSSGLPRAPQLPRLCGGPPMTAEWSVLCAVWLMAKKQNTCVTVGADCGAPSHHA